MAKPKIYQARRLSVNMERVQNILREDKNRIEYVVWAVATSKAEATKMVSDVNLLSYMADKDWRVAWDSPETLSLKEAGLLTLGAVLVTSSAGGEKPVVLVDQDGYATSIGMLKRPAGNDRVYPQRLEFLPTEAKYARKGSIAVGREVAFINTGRSEDRRWAGTDGYSVSDERMQAMLDLGEVEMVRAGQGAWHNGGI